MCNFFICWGGDSGNLSGEVKTSIYTHTFKNNRIFTLISIVVLCSEYHTQQCILIKNPIIFECVSVN